MSSLLSVEAVTKRFNAPPKWVRAGLSEATFGCREVSLTVQSGEFVTIVGESGAGKSTVCRVILGLEKPDSGRVLLSGIDLYHLGRRRLRDLRPLMQPVFQDPLSSLNPLWTIGRSITHGLRVHGLGEWSGLVEAQEGLLRRVGLEPGLARRYPHEISGGQRQRVCIGRAIAILPKLIVADEALSGLDVTTQARILRLLKDLQKETGMACLLVTHDLRTARRVSDRVIVMYRGQVVEQGSSDLVFENPKHEYTQKLLRESLPVKYTGKDWS